MFDRTDKVGVHMHPAQKAAALAEDYLRAGKSIDWVLSNVGGKRADVCKAILAKAEQMRVITPDQRDALEKRHTAKGR